MTLPKHIPILHSVREYQMALIARDELKLSQLSVATNIDSGQKGELQQLQLRIDAFVEQHFPLP